MPECDHILIDLLSQEDALLSEIFDLLTKEQNALRQLQRDELVELSRAKSERLSALDKATQRHMDLLKTHDLPANRQGMQDYIQRHLPLKQQERVLVLWEGIQEKLTACAKLNVVNGRVTQINGQQVTSIINYLKGNTHIGAYDAKGQTTSHGSNSHGNA